MLEIRVGPYAVDGVDPVGPIHAARAPPDWIASACVQEIDVAAIVGRYTGRP